MWQVCWVCAGQGMSAGEECWEICAEPQMSADKPNFSAAIDGIAPSGSVPALLLLSVACNRPSKTLSAPTPAHVLLETTPVLGTVLPAATATATARHPASQQAAVLPRAALELGSAWMASASATQGLQGLPAMSATRQKFSIVDTSALLGRWGSLMQAGSRKGDLHVFV
jgi:hypothetical protein